MQSNSNRVPTIGMLDADLGGLWLVAAIQARWPATSVHYLADTALSPIGERGPALIGDCIRKGIAYLRVHGADIVVLASQSMAAASAADPAAAGLVNPLHLAAAAAAAHSASGRIGVIGSRATVASEAYPKAIRTVAPKATVHCVAAPLLVPLMDGDWQNKPETRMIVKKYLHRLKVRQVDTLILAGSRYGAIGRLMGRKIGRTVHLIDPLACALDALALRLAPVPGPVSAFDDGCRIEVTDLTPAVAGTARSMLKRHVVLGEVHL